jgi:hypothetical protein
MDYYGEKRQKTMKVLDLLFMWAAFSIVFALCLHACAKAIDADQEHLLSPSERAEIVARW